MASVVVALFARVADAKNHAASRTGAWLAALASFIVCVACGSKTPEEPPEQASQKKPAPSAIGTSQAALTVTQPDYKSLVLGDQPVGYWRLGDTTLTPVTCPSGWPSACASSAKDEMGTNPGFYYGFPYTDSVQAKVDTAGALVGDRDGAPTFYQTFSTTHYPPLQGNSVLIQDHPNQHFTGSFSLECWATVPGTGNYPAQYSSPILKNSVSSNIRDGYGIYHFIYQGLPYWAFYFYGLNAAGTSLNNVIAAPAPSLKPGALSSDTLQSRFHHIVGVYDNTAHTMSVYADGAGWSHSTPVLTSLNIKNTLLGIGMGSEGANASWYGKIDEVAIYDHALSADQVKAHYQAGTGYGAIAQVSPANVSATYSNTVWVSPQASSALKATAADLARNLSTIAPQPVTVPDTLPGTPPTDSIQLIRSQGYTGTSTIEQTLLTDLATRDLLAFAAISDPTSTNGLKIISRSDAGLQMGASFYLHLLGARFVLPNSKWTFTSPRTSIRWNVARVEQPDFRWGADFAVSGDDPGFGPDANFHNDWQWWKAHNLLMSGVELGTFGADNFNGRNTLKSATNPLGDSLDTMGDTYAMTNNQQTGTKTSHPDWRAHDSSGAPVAVTTNFGWHVMNNTAFQTFFKQDRLAQMATAVAADPNAPASFAVSTELPQGTTDFPLVEDADPSVTSPSNTAATLANAVATGINTAYPGQGRYVSYFALNTHSAVPAVTLSANVITTIFPYAQNTGQTADQFVTSWAYKNIAVHDDWASAPTSLEQPQLDWFTELPRRTHSWFTARAGAVRNDSTLAAGASGFPWYIAAQIAWDNKVTDTQLRDDALDLAFGPDAQPDSARAEMKTMLQRWATTGFALNQTELTASLTNLQTSLSLTSDPGIKARITDFVAYVHFLVLYYEYSIGQRMRDCQILDNTTSGTPDALIQYMWRINDRDMVQAYWMMRRIISPPANTGLQAHPELASKWNSSGTGGGWDTVGTLIDDTMLANLLACDLTPPPSSQCNTVPGGAPACSATCPCSQGQGSCTSDDDCRPGNVCGTNNGAFFGQARSVRICWANSCAQQPLQDCGAPTSSCGPTCLFAAECTSDSDCGSGEVCGSGNGAWFSSTAQNVCWAAACETQPHQTGCGGRLSPCGLCTLSGSVIGPFNGDTISDTAPQFQLLTPHQGYYFAHTQNLTTNAFDFKNGMTYVDGTTGGLWNDCPANGAALWYNVLLNGSMPSSSNASYPWEYYGASDTLQRNLVYMQVVDSGMNSLASFERSNIFTGETFGYCEEQYSCSTDIVNNCSGSFYPMVLYTGCGATGGHCCMQGLQNITPIDEAPCSDPAATCDWDLVCRSNLWPAGMSSEMTTEDDVWKKVPFGNDWTIDIQGLAQAGNYWFVTQGNSSGSTRGALYRAPLDWWFAGPFPANGTAGNGGTYLSIDEASPQMAGHISCSHWGDPEATPDGYVYVPMENCNEPCGDEPQSRRLVKFDFDLNPVADYALCGTGLTNAPSVAIHPMTREVYLVGPEMTSNNPYAPEGPRATEMYVYREDLTKSPPKLKFNRKVQLGTSIGGVGGGGSGVQGFAFSPTGSKFYVVDQDNAPTMPHWDSNVKVFQVNPMKLDYVTRYPINIDFGDNQETEGLTVVNTNGHGCPSPTGDACVTVGEGEIHLFVYKDPSNTASNVGGSWESDTWLKHINVIGGPY